MNTGLVVTRDSENGKSCATYFRICVLFLEICANCYYEMFVNNRFSLMV